MKYFKLILKRLIFSIGILAGLLSVGVSMFMYSSPQFGGEPTVEQFEKIKSSPNYSGDAFVNLTETKMDFSFVSFVSTLGQYITAKNRRPKDPLPVYFNNENSIPVVESSRGTYVTWFGHSAILVEMDGKRILIDPMLSAAASPVSFFGKRFDYEEPIVLKELTDIDVIVISHDHYDHLDFTSIKELNSHTGHYIVPLGVGAHLQRWGIHSSKITELDWWHSVEKFNIKFTATPARHFSGRGITDRNKTLWASWVIQGSQSLYFSGDSGYGPHFKEIGDKFGPFDFTMIECGQYNENWEAIHMMPEQSFKANKDLQGMRMMPIHWGAFALSLHSWTEPVERLLEEAKRNNAQITTPHIGKKFSINEPTPRSPWWRESSRASAFNVNE